MTDDRLLQRLLDQVENRYYGKYQGYLVDNEDPQKRGRLRVLVPEVLRGVVSGWAEPCFPYGGGPDFGSFSIPPITRDADGHYTTGIWVEFRGGNPQFPIWVGTFPGAPGGTSEAPGDDAPPDVDVHVGRSASGASRVFVDTPGRERSEWRDAAGQRLTMSSPMKPGTKRDDNGQKATETTNVSYSDLIADRATVELVDFAGNSVLLDADSAAPTIRLTNRDRDGSVQQTIELFGGTAGPRIVITDDHQNVITMDRDGIAIEAASRGDTIVMNARGIQEDAPEINLNSGRKGAARLDDRVRSTMVEDSTYWTWVNTLMLWLASHTHMTTIPGQPTSPPIMPFPGTVPAQCVGKIIESSATVIVGD